jgi:hypothetical protein
MKFPFHLFRLQPPRTNEHEGETVQIASKADVQHGAPLFRAPALPTLHQINNELPFTVNYRPRIRERV